MAGPKKLSVLLEAVDDYRLIGNGDTVIRGITYDSRLVKPGMLFAAISGYRQDGRQFIPDAVKNGAAAILTDKKVNVGCPLAVVADTRKALADAAAAFHDFPGRAMEAIGVTGTNGKSSSVFMIHAILSRAGHKAGMINSLVYDTGLSRYRAERTTPDSVEMQQYLAEMKEAGCSHAVIEVSSHSLMLHRVDNIDFTAGPFTNISRDHLDFHETMEKYLEAKKGLLYRLHGRHRCAVINVDVAAFESLIREAPSRVITFSAEGNRADVKVEKCRLHADRTEFVLAGPTGRKELALKLPGRYNLINALGAAATGFALGIDPGTIAEALESAAPVPGRFQPVDRGQPFMVIIDYAHTPDAIERLCRSAREITSGGILILFGCGGDRDRGKRPLMAEAASRHADRVVLTSDNPRSEDPRKIIDDALPGMVRDNYTVIIDRREAIRQIIMAARKGDTVLIAGKGAEDYQEIGDRKYPFNEIEEIEKVLRDKGYQEVKTG